MADQEVKIKYGVEGADQATQKTNKLKDAFNKMGTATKLLTAGAIAGLAKGIMSCVDAFAKQEKATVLLQSALKATGQEVANNTKDMSEFATHLQRITTVGDETSLALMQMGLNMGLTAKQSKQATQDAIGLSKAYGIDTQAAIKAVSLAQLGNYDMLNRYIPALRTVTDETEKAALTQKLLGAAFDVAKAETQTFSGAMAQLKNAFGDAQEVVGGMFAPALAFVAKGLGAVVTWFNDLGPTVQTAVVVLALLAAGAIVIIPIFGLLAAAVMAITWPMIAIAAAIAAVVVGVIYLANAMAPLTEKTKKLTDEHERLKNKTEELRDQMKALADQGKENSSEYLKLQNELKKTNKDLTKNELQLRKNISALDDERKAIEAKIKAQEGDVAKAQTTKGNEDDIKELEKLEALQQQRLEIIAAGKDAETELLLQKNEEQNIVLGEQSAIQEEEKAANQLIIDEGKKLLDAEKQANFEAQLKSKTDKELKAAGFTAANIAAIRKLQEADMKASFDATMGYLASGMSSKNKEMFAIGKAASIAQAIMSGATAFNVALASAPPPFNFMLAAAVAAMAADKVSQISSTEIKLAEGGSMVVDSPTMIGNNVLAGEAGPERIDVTPLNEQQSQTINNNIYLDGELITTQVFKTGAAMKSEGTL